MAKPTGFLEFTRELPPVAKQIRENSCNSWQNIRGKKKYNQWRNQQAF